VFVSAGRCLPHRGGAESDRNDDDDDDDDDNDDDDESTEEWCGSDSSPSIELIPAQFPSNFAALAEDAAGGGCGLDDVPSLSPPPLPRFSGPRAQSLDSSAAVAAALAAAVAASAMSLSSPTAQRR
jgi:hypothetical protein